MRVLEYTGLDTTGVPPNTKPSPAIAREDFRAADVKKLVNLTHGKFYRAKLDGAGRLLFALVRQDHETCALILEVIAQPRLRQVAIPARSDIDETRSST